MEGKPCPQGSQDLCVLSRSRAVHCGLTLEAGGCPKDGAANAPYGFLFHHDGLGGEVELDVKGLPVDLQIL